MKIRSHQQGLAAIEFIIALPVLLLLMAAMADIGHLFIQYNVLNKTVQNGANYAAIRMQEATLLEPTPNINSVSNDTKTVVVYGSPDMSQSSVMTGMSTGDVNVAIDDAAKTISVSASYQYNAFFSPLPFTNIEVGKNLTASADVLYRN
ncbi:TadE/TadG family type IV pilus assembly protein [Vibrio litoralis]|uniref:TadE/TadG family type IV pilus assembly protein n=1 Tax=Vibrio litoralis TaxID=335972 RepID=UPI0004205662|nr:TadE/TadG family type IV pilus assembly protein [Vibrio litoralis]